VKRTSSSTSSSSNQSSRNQNVPVMHDHTDECHTETPCYDSLKNTRNGTTTVCKLMNGRLSYPGGAGTRQGLRFSQDCSTDGAPCTPGAGADADAQCSDCHVSERASSAPLLLADTTRLFWQTRFYTIASHLPLSL
jgi:hypothetical protein